VLPPDPELAVKASRLDALVARCQEKLTIQKRISDQANNILCRKDVGLLTPR
jgi:hypothetical protein